VEEVVEELAQQPQQPPLPVEEEVEEDPALLRIMLRYGYSYLTL
jgi:hypothetical protein